MWASSIWILVSVGELNLGFYSVGELHLDFGQCGRAPFAF